MGFEWDGKEKGGAWKQESSINGCGFLPEDEQIAPRLKEEVVVTHPDPCLLLITH